MNSKAIYFVAGVVFGAAAFAGAQAYLAQPDKVADTGAPDLVKHAQAALADVKKREALLDERTKALDAKEQQLLADTPAPGANGPAADNQKAPGAAFAKIAGAAIKQQADMQMTALKSRLKLSDDQTKAIQDVMDKQSQFQQAMAEKMLSGNLSEDDLQKAMQDQGGMPPDLEAQLQSILTPDQYAEYNTYQNDQKKSQAEAMANMELMQIQSTLQLSEDQKDKVFAAIYQMGAQQMGVDGAKPAANSGNIEAQFEAKKAALQSVLTPEQFDAYSKFVDSQKSMVQSMMGTVGGGNQSGDGNSTVQSTTTVTIAPAAP